MPKRQALKGCCKAVAHFLHLQHLLVAGIAAFSCFPAQRDWFVVGSVEGVCKEYRDSSLHLKTCCSDIKFLAMSRYCLRRFAPLCANSPWACCAGRRVGWIQPAR